MKPSKRLDAARELAWIDYLCRMRNQAVQHRVDRGSELIGYTVEVAFSATYSDPGAIVDLAEITRLYNETQADYPAVTLEATGGPADAAYLLSLAERLHDLEPERAD